MVFHAPIIRSLRVSGQEAGEAARSQILKTLERCWKATTDLVTIRLKQLRNWRETKEKAGKGQA